MSSRLRLHRPSELSAEHLGVHVEATEAGGMADGGLSDFQHCDPHVLVGRLYTADGHPLPEVLLEPSPGCPLHPQPTHAHTHLWLGGKGVTLSEARGRVAVSVPIDPTTGLSFPGENS